MSEKSIDKRGTSRDQHIAITERVIEIQHRGKPIISGAEGAGYVYLVIDSSVSMKGDKLNQAKAGTLRFAKDALAKGYSTGLIQFDSIVKQLSEPTREISLLEQCLGGMKANGSTDMAAAIHLAHRQLVAREGSRVMVIVTDGMPDSIEDSLRTGKEAKNDGIDIIAIGTDDADQEFLTELSSRTDLGIKVAREKLEHSIASSAKMLPPKSRTEVQPDKKTS